jgi:hypothetical protein
VEFGAARRLELRLAENKLTRVRVRPAELVGQFVEGLAGSLLGFEHARGEVADGRTDVTGHCAPCGEPQRRRNRGGAREP